MPSFTASFILYKNGLEIFGDIPAQRLFIEEFSDQKELRSEISNLEKSLSEEFGGRVVYLIVTADGDISGTTIKKGAVIMLNLS